MLRIITRLGWGGPPQHVAVLAEGLQPFGYTTTVVTGATAPGEPAMDHLFAASPCPVIKLSQMTNSWRSPGQDLLAVRELVRIIRREQPDLVHTHTTKAGLLGRCAARLCRVPVVVHTYHGHLLQGYFGRLMRRSYILGERLLGRWSTAVVALTPRLKAEIAAAGICPPRKIAVIPLGLPLQRFADCAALRGTLRRELGLAASVPLVGFLTRFVPVKDPGTALQAFARVARARPDVHFTVLGYGPLESEMRSACTRLALADRVHFLGMRPDVRPFYADVDVVVLTSLNEGLPVVLLEALASGTPVVSTAVGGVPDLLRNGAWGKLTARGAPEQIARALLATLHDGPADSLPAARDFVLATYDAQSLTEAVAGLYDRLLDGGPGPDPGVIEADTPRGAEGLAQPCRPLSNCAHD